MVLAVSLVLTIVFLSRWYSKLYKSWPKQPRVFLITVFSSLPLLALAGIFLTLRNLASFDVVGDFFYVLLYIFLGITWIFFALTFVSMIFDISWIDDAVNINNKSAIITLAGAFLGAAAIYCGANVGDGPGWWCVVLAGGIGMALWFILIRILNRATGIFERVTVERNLPSGIRFGSFILALAIILARASSGDWTSFIRTIIEFADGWPALPLTAFALITELFFAHQSKTNLLANEGNYKTDETGSMIFSSVLGLLYIGAAVACSLLPSVLQ